jgi:hypothetical protein
VAIATGTASFTTTAGLAYTPGARVRASVSGTPTSWVEGYVTDYTAGVITMTVDLINGSGSYSNWNLNATGVQGVQGPIGVTGATGATGTTGATGPGYLATSTTNLPIALGVVTIQVPGGLAYAPGARARLSSNINPTQWMEGVVTGYAGTNLTISIDLTSAMAASTYVPPVLPNFLGGLILANDITTPNTVLDIGLGGATSDDNSTLMTMATANFTKACNAAWSVGSGGGALDAGTALAASTWYHVFLIERTDTLVVDVLISTSLTPAMPSFYTKKRRIGSIRTNTASHISPFTQVGDEFLWADPSLVLTTTSAWQVSNVAVPLTPGALFTLAVPVGIKSIAMINVVVSLAPNATTLTLVSPDMTSGYDVNWALPTMVGQNSGMQSRVRTNTNSQIHISAAGGVALTASLYMNAVGWIDNRGK